MLVNTGGVDKEFQRWSEKEDEFMELFEKVPPSE